jgi:hypothetical protein
MSGKKSEKFKGPCVVLRIYLTVLIGEPLRLPEYSAIRCEKTPSWLRVLPFRLAFCLRHGEKISRVPLRLAML